MALRQKRPGSFFPNAQRISVVCTARAARLTIQHGFSAAGQGMTAVTLALNYRKTANVALKVLVGALESDARTRNVD